MAANLLQRAYAFFDPHIAVNDQGYLVNAEGFFDSGTESRDYINPDELSDTQRQMYYNSEFAGFDPLEGFMLDPVLDENASIEQLVQTVGDAAKTNFVSFLYIGAILTMNLGVFNFIPFPALDGGRFLLLCVEAIRRKPIDKKIEGYINFVGLIILFGFMIFITCKDIFNLFG